MRIIKEGQKPIKEWQVTCHKCGCIFVFDNRDVHSDQREGDWVVCPTCKEYIAVTHRNLLNENIKHL
jgi:NAD-dependent SIR2 family protein deacetylase